MSDLLTLTKGLVLRRDQVIGVRMSGRTVGSGIDHTTDNPPLRYDIEEWAVSVVLASGGELHVALFQEPDARLGAEKMYKSLLADVERT